LSVYKNTRSCFYIFDFEIDGRRFFGSTKRTNKREAEAVEAEKREEAKRELKLARDAATSRRLDDIAGRYWSEVGQHHAGAKNTQRYPMTVSGVATAWKRLRKRAGVEGFRFHDFRHDVGAKLLRETGNLKLVQRALNHRSIKSTLRYAHVLDDEVADAMESRLSLKKSLSLSDRKIS
jgi:integrase